MSLPRIVSQAEWEAARYRLLVKEKEATRARDALAAERRRLPINWLRVLDTAESSQVDQRVGHQLHAIMPLLDTFETE